MFRAFEGITGQDQAVEYLQSALDAGRTTHAYLICGGAGSGKEEIAKRFSAALLSNGDEEQFRRLKEAGVTRYHANIETSRRNFPNICTTHTFDDKLECIRRAQAAGLDVCSGGIIGMGESWEDRADMALTLSEMGVKSVPINVLRPIKGTPFGHLERIPEEDIIRTVVMFRFILPEADVRLAAGRDLMSGSGDKAFMSGANSTITGDMLTTSGNKIDDDTRMLAGLGFTL